MCVLNYCAWQCPIPSFGKIHAAFVLPFTSTCQSLVGASDLRSEVVQERQSAPYPFEPRRLSCCSTLSPPSFPFFTPQRTILNITTNEPASPRDTFLSSPPQGASKRQQKCSLELAQTICFRESCWSRQEIGRFQNQHHRNNCTFRAITPAYTLSPITLFLQFISIATTSTPVAVSGVLELGYTGEKGCCHSFRNHSRSLALIRLLQTPHDCNIHDLGSLRGSQREGADLGVF